MQRQRVKQCNLELYSDLSLSALARSTSALACSNTSVTMNDSAAVLIGANSALQPAANTTALVKGVPTPHDLSDSTESCSSDTEQV